MSTNDKPRAQRRVTRRQVLQWGGLSLVGHPFLPDTLLANASGKHFAPGPAKSVILFNLFGGPSHIDMFDLKPQAPANVRGEFQPISTCLPGVQIGELLPMTAQVMDRMTLIRTYSHKYNSHNPYNVLTGFDGGSDRENYFAKPNDHPGMGAICQSLNVGRNDIPRYVMMPAYPGWSQALRRAGPYGGYLGSQFDPLTTVCSPKFATKGEFYKPVLPTGQPILPSLDELPNVTSGRLELRKNLLRQVEQRGQAPGATRGTQSMSAFQAQVFDLLTSPRTRDAFDLSQESPATRDRYGRNLWANSMIVARRLVEAGSTFVVVNWEEADSGNHWDMHNNVFGMQRVLVPALDRIISATIQDLEERGLLDETLVVIMGEMGRTPKVNGKAGRDHWPQCGFALLAGGGIRRGMVLGKTDKQAAYPIDRPVSAGDLVATIYRQIGIDYGLTVDDLTGRPIHISHGGEPVTEIIG